jgi:TonB family protein
MYTFFALAGIRVPRRLLLTLLALLLGLVPMQRSHAADPLTQLTRILRSAQDYKQRLAAVIGLGRRKDRRAVPALIKALGDSHHTVRGAAARVLGALGDLRAKPALTALLLGAKHDYVRGQTQKALAALMAREEGHRPGGPRRMAVHGALGSLDQESIQEGINARLPGATHCLGQALERSPYLGGKIALKIRVATDGKVRWVRVVRSDLGSLEVERCIVAGMHKASFDAPDGGEAEFSIPLTFGGGDAVTLLDPQSSTVARRLRRGCKKLLRGRLRPPPGLQVGLYLDPRGAVVSAGLAAGGAEIKATFAEAFVANLKRLKLREPSDSGRYRKLVYSFGCGR